MSRSKRSTSCPCKATSKVPQKCYYYHVKKFCKWGDHCKFMHRLYIEKPPRQTLCTHMYLSNELLHTHDPKAKLMDARERLRKADINNHIASLRSALLASRISQTPILPKNAEKLPAPPKQPKKGKNKTKKKYKPKDEGGSLVKN